MVNMQYEVHGVHGKGPCRGACISGGADEDKILAVNMCRLKGAELLEGGEDRKQN